MGTANEALVTLEGVPCMALLDTGSQVTTLAESFYQQHFKDAPLIDCTQLLKIEGAGGHAIPYLGYFSASVKVDGAPAMDVPVLVVMTTAYNSTVPCLIGTNILRRLNPEPDATLQPGVFLAIKAVQLAERHLNHSHGIYGTVYSAEQHVLKPGEVRTVCGNVRVTVPIATDLAYLCSEDSSTKLCVVPGLVDVFSTIKNINMELVNLEADTVTIDKGATLGNLQQTSVVCQSSCEEEELLSSVNIDHIKEFASQEEYTSICNMFGKWKHVFSRDSTDIGQTSVLKHRIDLIDETPVKERARRIPPNMLEELREHLQQLQRTGIIEESNSSWCSPIVLVRKKSGELRLCVDYRKLNLQTKKDSYAIPTIEQLLDMLGGSSWFASLDLTSGYHQVEVEESHKERTAFTAGPLGFWHYRKMPFGLCNSPATFQRMMERVLEGLNLRICLVYLDDVIIFGETIDQLRDRLDQVLYRISTCGLKLRPNKCEFFQRRLKYLGHIVTSEGVECDPSMLETVANWEVPKDVKQLQSFLGFSNFFRRFIAGFAKIAQPLTKLLGSDKRRKSKTKSVLQAKQKEPVEWKWEDEQKLAFDKLKEALTSPPLLTYADWNRPFIVRTDASIDGLGAVLCQDVGDKAGPKVIAYASRSLKPAEKNYSAYKLEFLAMYWAITKKFSHYLHGREFTVTTDHNPLTYVLSSAKLDAAGHRWLAELSSSYRFNIIYKPGRANIDADLLSRKGTIEITEDEVKAAAQAHLEDDEEWHGLICCLPAVLEECSDSVYPETANCNMVNMQDMIHEEVDWAVEQDKDAAIHRVKQLLDEGNSSHQYSHEVSRFMRERKRLVIEDRVLLRTGLHKRIVVPKHLKGKILNFAHDKMGHQGRERTTSILCERFFWPGVTKDTDNYIKQCERCVRAKPLIPHRAPLKPITSSEPMELVCMDYLKLESSKGGYSNILLITDHFTRYALAIATTSQSAAITAKHLLENFIYKFGMPRRLLSDQGGSFEARVIQELCKSHGIVKTRTSPYHPETDGATERMNRSLLNMLRTLETYKKADWKQHLSRLIHAYNSTKHASTGYSPHYIMFGHHPRLPIDALLPQPLAREDTCSDYVRKMRKSLREVYSLAADKSLEAKAKQKLHYDKKVYGSCPEVGDRVLVKRHQFDGKHKIADRWEEDIYKIVARDRPGVPIYRVKPEHGRGRERVLHRNNLLPVTWPLEELKPQVHTPQCKPAKPTKDCAPAVDSEDDSECEASIPDIHVQLLPAAVTDNSIEPAILCEPSSTFDSNLPCLEEVPSTDGCLQTPDRTVGINDDNLSVCTNAGYSSIADEREHVQDGEHVQDDEEVKDDVEEVKDDEVGSASDDSENHTDDDDDEKNEPVPRKYPSRTRRCPDWYGDVVSHQVRTSLAVDWRDKAQFMLNLVTEFPDYREKILDSICAIMIRC